MFWKRKINKGPRFVIDSDDQRIYFRVSPPNKLPAKMSVDDHIVEIVDIGAGGVSFNNIGLKKGNKYSAVIRITGYQSIILADISIINIDIKDVCHCYFSEILDKDVDAIHKYVLEVQKTEIREKKIYNRT